jgi:polysaccharide export outer membrane protein
MGHDDMMTGSQKMRRMFSNALGMAGLVLIQLGATATARAEDVPYTINPGDTLIISAFDDERLDRELMVLPDGSISYPVAGKIETAGKTVGEVQDIITKELVDKGFLQEGSVVSVSVGKTTGNTIYVLGQVKQPGAFTVFTNVDVTQALSLAGGLTPFASRRNIVILRQENGKRTAIPFNYSKIEDGEELETNITLKSGDVIMVPD